MEQAEPAGGVVSVDDLLVGADHELIDAASLAVPRAIRGLARRRLLGRLGKVSAETLAEVEAACDGASVKYRSVYGPGYDSSRFGILFFCLSKINRVRSMATVESRPARDAPKQDEEKSIAERFEGREPKFDIVRFSAPWRPFAKLTHLLRLRTR